MNKKQYDTFINQILERIIARDYSDAKKLCESCQDENIENIVCAYLNVFERYYKYLDDAIVVNEKNNGVDSIAKKIFMGSDNFDNSYIHEEYLYGIKKDLEELLSLLSSNKTLKEREINLFSKMVVSILIELKQDTPKRIRYILCADDYLACDLLKYLDINDLKTIYNEYGSIKNQARAYPNQKKLIVAMENILKSNNIEVYKKSKFDLFKEKFGLY